LDSAHAPALEKEFALVGFGGYKAAAIDAEGEGLERGMAKSSVEDPSILIKEKSLNEFATYATGRQNAPFSMPVSLSISGIIPLV
jgi:hypothetical protein